MFWNLELRGDVQRQNLFPKVMLRGSMEVFKSFRFHLRAFITGHNLWNDLSFILLSCLTPLSYQLLFLLICCVSVWMKARIFLCSLCVSMQLDSASLPQHCQLSFPSHPRFSSISEEVCNNSAGAASWETFILLVLQEPGIQIHWLQHSCRIHLWEKQFVRPRISLLSKISLLIALL